MEGDRVRILPNDEAKAFWEKWWAGAREPRREAKHPFRVAEIFRVAEEALKSESKVEEWKPKLKKLISGHLDGLGEEIRTGEAKSAIKTFEDLFGRDLEVRREGEDLSRHYSIVLVGKGVGQKVDLALLICREASFKEIEPSVVICLGPIKTDIVDKGIST